MVMVLDEYSTEVWAKLVGDDLTLVWCKSLKES